ncbi:MAG: AAA family ATPase [Rhodothermales bacterium]|nr:AAA family ATPase [Rhodothermales bacterium]
MGCCSNGTTAGLRQPSPKWRILRPNGVACAAFNGQIPPRVTDDLFAPIPPKAPLADRMRPRTLDDFAGQAHVLGPGKLLRRAVEADRVTSVILYGPPGIGKTTLARIVAATTKKHFIALNAVLSGVKDIRDAIAEAQNRRRTNGQGTILFVDEVHRFNKAQQDALLPHVENGTVTFVGATTENPYFEVNKALVSRSRIFELHPLTTDDLVDVARRALADVERGYGHLKVLIDDDALDHLVSTANGDARSLLNALELAVETTPESAEPSEDESSEENQGVDKNEAYQGADDMEDGQPQSRIRITRAVAEDSIQRRAVLYDKEGDAHFDIVSAFIKSLRGSDPDAALYWMARMVYAGEDPRFIFRRMVIFASEDVGMADPRALQIALAAAQAYDYIGMPEGRFPMAQACLYLATAPKSNSGFAFFDALAHVEKEQTNDVPNPLKDSSRDKKGLGHGEGYLYPHAYRDHYVAEQYLPAEMQGLYFYQPSDMGYEKTVAERLAYFRRRDEDESVVKRAQRYADEASSEAKG